MLYCAYCYQLFNRIRANGYEMDVKIILVVLITCCFGKYSLSDTITRQGCCQNGGTCLLGSFCTCPPNYIGRFCQYEIKFRNCNHVRHGHWIRSDCNQCRCFDGEIVCIRKVYSGCDDDHLPIDPKKKIDPFKGKKIEIYPPDQADTSDEPDDKFLDYYYVDEMVSNSASSACVASVVLCYLFMLTLFNHFFE